MKFNSKVLIAESLYKTFCRGGTEVTAVQNVSFSLRRGEFVVLLGRSGSGKSTLFSLLAGILRPTKGRVVIDGVDLTKLSSAEKTIFRRKKIGIVFQRHNLIPFLSALDNVLLMIDINETLCDEEKRRAESLLDEIGLKDRKDFLPSELSGGECQRVAIARSLIHNPLLLLVDEPTASLDSDRGLQIAKLLLDQVRRFNRTCMVATHDLRICEFADRILEICDGKIINEHLSSLLVKQPK
jgi:putative ABC transport system ATP-binding protein